MTECPECGHDEVERSGDGYEVACCADDCGVTSVDTSLGRNEELRQPDWDTAVPERLTIEAYSDDEDEDEADEDEETADASTLARHEARNRRRHGESLRQIRDNIQNNPDTGNPYSLSTIQKWTDDIDPTPNSDAEAGAD
jgi:transcription initiation factor TFIIIB Brf1 subunit/transcription initiation factor TFIIB